MMNVPEPTKSKSQIVYSVANDKIAVEPGAYKVSAHVEFSERHGWLATAEAYGDGVHYTPSDLHATLKEHLADTFPGAEIEVTFGNARPRDYYMSVTISTEGQTITASSQRDETISIEKEGEKDQIDIGHVYRSAEDHAMHIAKEREKTTTGGTVGPGLQTQTQAQERAKAAAQARAKAAAVSTFAARARPGSAPRSGPRM